MRNPFVILLLALVLVLAACAAPQPASEPAAADAEETEAEGAGQLTIVANGEDFVRQGFVTKDGWDVQFDHLYVTLADVNAYRTDPPFDASTGETPDGPAVGVAGPITLDLAAGDENAEPITIGQIEDAPAGQYNALGWRMVPATEGEASGATIRLIGTASKDGETVVFTLSDATNYAYNCGEFVGDGRKGILAADGNADIEATFHFDHVFGDADAPSDDALNVGALGFDPLAALAQDGMLDMTVADLENSLGDEDVFKLKDTLATLGHVGEGHCFEAVGGYTGHSE